MMKKKIYSNLEILKQLKNVPKPKDSEKVMAKMRELRGIMKDKLN